MPAIMANDGVFVPEGGVYEIVLALERLARHAGVEIRTGEPVREICAGKVMTAGREYAADAVVSGLDADRLEGLLDPRKKRTEVRLSCSGIAVYAALRKELTGGVATHSVVLPSDPAALYASLEAGEEPRETMAFVNYYRGGEIYPNKEARLRILLTAPANGREYGLKDTFVAREIERVSEAAGLPGPPPATLVGTGSWTPRTSEAGGARAGRSTVPCAPSGGADRCTGPVTTSAGIRGCGGSGLRSIPGGGIPPSSAER